MDLCTVAIQVRTVGKTDFVTNSRVALLRVCRPAFTLGPSTTRRTETIDRFLWHADSASGTAASLSVIPAIVRTTHDLCARTCAIGALARVAVFLHVGIVSLKDDSTGQTAVPPVVLVIWKNKSNCLSFNFCYSLRAKLHDKLFKLGSSTLL